MYSKTPTGKASKGTVQVLNSNGRLQLRFRFANKRHYISLGLADTAPNRKLAEMKAREIELDMLSGHFDQTLLKYKPHSAFTTESPDITPKITPTLQNLWKSYAEYRASSVKETTREYHATFTRLFDRLTSLTVTDALAVKAALEEETTIYQTKRALMQINAACKWAKKHGLIDSNPYDGMSNEMPKYRYQVEPNPNAFTEEEREQVLEAFRNHRGNWNGRGYTGYSYSHYVSFVEFLFLTGCRPSEAIGLQWKNVSSDCGTIHFTGSITTSGNGKKIRVDSSKNNKKRHFPCSSRLREMLLSIRPESVDPEQLVFPAPKGKSITYNNFCNSAWNKIVDPIKPETTPYSCRDTFITTQILKGVPESVK